MGSWLPQGSVLGPFNDLPDNVELDYLLHDHAKIYSTFKDTSDNLLPTKNLDMVNEWSHKWLLKFNVDKCKPLQSGTGNSSQANT